MPSMMLPLLVVYNSREMPHFALLCGQTLLAAIALLSLCGRVLCTNPMLTEVGFIAD